MRHRKQKRPAPLPIPVLGRSGDLAWHRVQLPMPRPKLLDASVAFAEALTDAIQASSAASCLALFPRRSRCLGWQRIMVLSAVKVWKHK